MTDSIIDRATRALAKSQCGVDDLDGLDEEMQAKLREDVRAVLVAVREPSKEMLSDGMDAANDAMDRDYRSDADGDRDYYTYLRSDAPHQVWQAMIDAALAEPNAPPAQS